MEIAMKRSLLAAAVLVGAVTSVAAADLSAPVSRARHVVHTRIVVPRETHVVEVAIRPPGFQYVINGSVFTGSGPSCFGWGPQQRVALLAGEWHGQCSTAVFRNLSLGRTCEMACGGDVF
jgi:opacity protein-like surface antigen